MWGQRQSHEPLSTLQNGASLKVVDTSWVKAKNKKKQGSRNVIFIKGALCSFLNITEWLRNGPQCVK